MTTQQDHALEFTGERFLPGASGQIAFEHLHRYYFAKQLVSGKSVLDVACGEGYGSDILAAGSKSVVGVDIAPEAVAHAKARYARGNLAFVEASAAALPFEDGRFDVVVSFETIEHHAQHEEMLSEIHRVLRPGGILVLSSPDRRHYSIDPGYTNPFHVKELYLEEFVALVARHFRHAVLFGQRVVHGSLMVRQDAVSAFGSIRLEGQSAVDANPGLARPLYDILVASDGEVPALASSLFEATVHGMDPAGFYGVHLPERVATADQTILRVEADLAQARAETQARALSAAEVASRLEHLDGKLGGLDAKVERLTLAREQASAQLALVEERFSTQLAMVAGKLAAMTVSRAELEQARHEMQRRLAEGDAALSGARDRLDAREREIAELRNSRSWRCTAWLRAISGWLRRRG